MIKKKVLLSVYTTRAAVRLPKLSANTLPAINMIFTLPERKQNCKSIKPQSD